MKITIEATDLTARELGELTGITQTSSTLSMARERIRSAGLGLWAYQGGSHVSVHRAIPRGHGGTGGGDKRLAIITEDVKNG